MNTIAIENLNVKGMAKSHCEKIVLIPQGLRELTPLERTALADSLKEEAR